MKILVEIVLKTKQKYTLTGSIVLSAVYYFINTAMITLVAKIVNGNMYALKLLVLGIIVNIIVSYVNSYCNKMGRMYSYTYLCNEFSKKILNCDYEMFTVHSPGELHTSVGNIRTICNIPSSIIVLIKNVLILITTMYFMWIIDIKSVLVTIALCSVSALITLIMYKKYVKLDLEFERYKTSRTKEVDDAINGFAEVRSFKGKPASHLNNIINLNQKCTNAQSKKCVNFGINMASIEGVSGMITVIVILFVLNMIADGDISPAVGLSLVMYSWNLVDPTTVICDILVNISEFTAVLPKFNEVMQFRNTVPEGDIELDGFNNEIVFDNVSFEYDKSSRVLDGINLTIRKGDHIGICGYTGNGKSTLLKLLPKFYDVTDGSITIDGIDIRKLSGESLRSHMGIIHQDPYMFDGTILDNLKYANENVTENEIIEACVKARIYDFIMGLDDKFNTYIGPRGLKLSGGQKQRIALARLFIADPEIILLDEATSALDNNTEEYIQECINSMGGKTVIAIAHRLSTIKDMDKIVVIDNHKIVESGTHRELITKNGIYSKMYYK